MRLVFKSLSEHSNILTLVLVSVDFLFSFVLWFSCSWNGGWFSIAP
jgi:hypothetical protein